MSQHPMVPPPGTLTVYATSWCPYCSRLLAGLESAGIPADVVDVDEDADADIASAVVERINGGNRVVPTVVFPDGTTATNPDLSEVRRRLGRA